MNFPVQNKQNREEIVKESIEFVLSHFEGRQRLFSRKMSTFASQGKQFIVYNKEQILDACIKSKFLDCRLNAYPVIDDGLMQAPNIIFIDLDLLTKYPAYQDNLKQLNKNLEKSLKIIKQKLNGFKPTVLWTGNGYHIYIVLDVSPLELIEELKELSDHPSDQFLRFAEFAYTKNKKDLCHNPSFKSCLLRIPDTINLKNSSEIKIIQRYDVNNIPSIDSNLLRKFGLYLADIDIKKNIIEKDDSYKNNSHNLYKSAIQYEWIEKLLQTPIEDGRKYALWKILCPYLVNIKKLKFEESFEILKNWLKKCNTLRTLEFNPDTEIKSKLNNVKYYNPITIKTMIEDNKKLYLLLKK